MSQPRRPRPVNPVVRVRAQLAALAAVRKQKRGLQKQGRYDLGEKHIFLHVLKTRGTQQHLAKAVGSGVAAAAKGPQF